MLFPITFERYIGQFDLSATSTVFTSNVIHFFVLGTYKHFAASLYDGDRKAFPICKQVCCGPFARQTRHRHQPSAIIRVYEPYDRFVRRSAEMIPLFVF